MVQFEKFRDLATAKKITILPFKTCFYNYKKQLDQYNELFTFEHFIFNDEFIKINSLNLYEQVKNHIIKTLVKKNDTDALELLNQSILDLINSIVAILYKLTYIRTYENIISNYKKCDNLKNLNKLNENNYDLMIINHYNKSKLKNYEKLRYFHNFINKNLKFTANDLLYSLYWICTKSDKIPITDKEIFFNELLKIWDIIIRTAINNCMMYFIWYTKLNKRTLYMPCIKTSLIKNFLKLLKIKENKIK